MPENEQDHINKRVLEPYDRISEVFFGLVMALTFTGSLSVADAGRDDVRLMLIGALGCNLAWGIIDALVYLMGCLAERSRGLMTLHAVRRATDTRKAQLLVAGALPGPVANVLQSAELEMITHRLRELPPPPERAKLHADDWRGSIGVFFLVFLSTFPIALPFIFMSQTRPAMRVSNLIAMAMLFVIGAAFGRIIGGRAWVAGMGMVIFGAILVGVTIALGG